MIRTPVKLDIDSLPPRFAPYLDSAAVYDSSCSERARTYFVDRDCGYFLKTAPPGTLADEAVMDDYFHRKGLSARVWEYVSDETGDYLLTQRIHGEDGITRRFLDQPVRLCDTFSESLVRLHSVDFSDCPRTGRSTAMYAQADRQYTEGTIDPWLLEYAGVHHSGSGREFMLANAGILREDVLIHGDYCLPNILLDDNFRFCGFIDLGLGGVGDRHYDIFWGIWTLQFNLHTNDYMDRFIDGYGRSRFDRDRFMLNGIMAAFSY